MQAYTNGEYQSLLADRGFVEVLFYPSLGEMPGSQEGDLIGVLSQKEVA
jgi:hypothetical protein